ncbi:MAG: trypsin-like peptidase domain-containing protein [Clostridia bacterium]|nr:trypsin-like peptidase domain-containing protein [Clostridia bacterium]
MSFMNEFERERIYEEMDKSQSRSKTGIFSKLLSTALLLSIGFASGSIYSVFNNNHTMAAQETLSQNNNTTILTTNNQTTPTPQINTSNSLANVVNAVADSVIEITQYTTQSISPYISSNYTSEGNGSGVIISTDGYILTNNHVISGAEKISVRLRNGVEYEAKLIGKDAKTDIAIIKVEAEDLKAANIGNSSTTQVGDFVLAIGNPLGKLGGTVTYGFVSALEREITIDNTTMNLMQFDAAVNPGNSGGGLFNIYGDLIGVVSAKSTGYDVEGLGFAIPVNDVSQVIDDILTHGYATNRPFLGVSLDDGAYSTNNNSPFGGYGSLFDMFYQQVRYGASVSEVVKDSPAEKAGIETGDIIVSIDGKVVSTASEASSEIANYNVGDEIEIGLIRDSRTKTVTATLEEYKGQ